jgi:hypothetical protein
MIILKWLSELIVMADNTAGYTADFPVDYFVLNFVH